MFNFKNFFTNKFVLGGALVIIAGGLWAGALRGVVSAQQGNVLDNFFNLFSAQSGIKTNTAPAKLYDSTNSYEDAVISAVEKVSPAVVAITVSKNVPILENCQTSPFSGIPPEFQQFFGGIQFNSQCDSGKTRKQDIGGGSGFIVTSDGLILTNKHVVSEKDASYTVFTNDGKKYDAKVLARDSVQDLAIVKIDATGLPVVTLGDSDTVRLGQTTITVGNALAEFRNTVSVGVVSGLSRNVTAGGGGISEQLEGLIQTDAAINPGNSGGPLVNLRGEVIGINTAIVSGAQSIGFALPINTAKRDIDSVRKIGKILVPFLGVRYVLITPELAEKEKLDVEAGALVRGGEDGPAVAKNSPAAKAGIKAEDIITEVNGTKVSDGKSLLSLVQKYSVGDTINLKVLRDGKTLTIAVVLEERK